MSTWIGIAILILATALYVAAEFGVVGVRRSRIRRLADDGNLLARRLLPFVENPGLLDRYVGASQIGITLASLILGAVGQATVAVDLDPRLGRWLDLTPETSASTAAVVVLVALTALQVVIGELVPKSLALQFPTQVALATFLPMRASLALFRPFIAVINGSANTVLRWVGAGASAHRHIHSPDEIELMIAESRDGGLLEPDEQQRLRRALRLGRRSAADLMVPLLRLTMVAADEPWELVVQRVATSPYSRLPVYRGTREQVIGTLRAKDVLDWSVTQSGAASIDQLLRPVARLRSDVPADRVITILRDRRMHQAVVTNDADRVIGLITIQDVLAQFLGAGPISAEETEP